MEDITAQTGLLYQHKENDFNEFDRETLIPHMLSTEGPLAVGDINQDGLEDVLSALPNRKSRRFPPEPLRQVHPHRRAGPGSGLHL